MSSVAESIHPKSGLASSSTNSGTTTTTTSLRRTALAVSVVDDQGTRPDDLREVVGKVGLARERLGPGVDGLDGARR